jgi:NTP pyrophosphatase (non-canonical NTP hydrolase)
MNDHDYTIATRRTDPEEGYVKDGSIARRLSANPALMHYVLGIVTEAGELADAVKKAVIYGKDLDGTNIIEEIGDLQWYEARLLDLLDSSFADARRRNIAKLRLRFPDGFTEEAAVDRDTDAERVILESSFFAEVVKLITPPEVDLEMALAHAAEEEVLDHLRDVIEPPTGVAVMPSDNGFYSAPARYIGESGREKVDEMRDMCHSRSDLYGFVSPVLSISPGDMMFAVVCRSHADKYDRDKGAPETDAEKKRFWEEMEMHALGRGADPRSQRRHFTPWTLRGEG